LVKAGKVSYDYTFIARSYPGVVLFNQTLPGNQFEIWSVLLITIEVCHEVLQTYLLEGNIVKIILSDTGTFIT
jgi:hypothetical protein